MADEAMQALGASDRISEILGERRSALDAEIDRIRSTDSTGNAVGLSRGGALGALLLATLPALAGYMSRGKRGLTQGAGVGGDSLSTYLQLSANRKQQEDRAQQALLAGLLRERSGLEKLALQNEIAPYAAERKLEERLALESALQPYKTSRARAAAPNISVNGGASLDEIKAVLSAPQKKDVANAATIPLAAREVFMTAAELSPDMLKERYFDKDGNFDSGGFLQVMKNRGANLLVGRESEYGKLKSSLTDFFKEYQKLLSGLQATDKEFDKLSSVVYGEGLLPATIPTILQGVARLAEKGERLSAAKVALSGAVNAPVSPGDLERLYDQFGLQRGAYGTYIGNNIVMFPDGSTEKVEGADEKYDVGDRLILEQVD